MTTILGTPSHTVGKLNSFKTIEHSPPIKVDFHQPAPLIYNQNMAIIDKNTELVQGHGQEATNTIINRVDDSHTEYIFVYSIKETDGHVDKAGIVGRTVFKNNDLLAVVRMLNEYVRDNNLA